MQATNIMRRWIIKKYMLQKLKPKNGVIQNLEKHAFL